MKTLVACAVATSLLTSLSAWAGCSIHNDTKFDFTVESGNTSNQRVTPHTQTSIASGKVKGTSKDGKSISGSCKDGDRLEIKDEGGIPVLSVK